MAGELPHDLEFVEAARVASASARSKLVWPVSIVLLAIAVGVGFVAFTARDAKRTENAAAPSVFFDLPTFTVNLAPAEPPRSLTLALSLETADPAAAEAVQAAMPYLMDAFQTHLRELRPTELEGSAGLFRLRQELAKRVNLAIAPVRVRAVLVRDMQLK